MTVVIVDEVRVVHYGQCDQVAWQDLARFPLIINQRYVSIDVTGGRKLFVRISLLKPESNQIQKLFIFYLVNFLLNFFFFLNLVINLKKSFVLKVPVK